MSRMASTHDGWAASDWYRRDDSVTYKGASSVASLAPLIPRPLPLTDASATYTMRAFSGTGICKSLSVVNSSAASSLTTHLRSRRSCPRPQCSHGSDWRYAIVASVSKACRRWLTATYTQGADPDRNGEDNQLNLRRLCSLTSSLAGAPIVALDATGNLFDQMWLIEPAPEEAGMYYTMRNLSTGLYAGVYQG